MLFNLRFIHESFSHVALIVLLNQSEFLWLISLSLQDRCTMLTLLVRSIFLSKRFKFLINRKSCLRKTLGGCSWLAVMLFYKVMLHMKRRPHYLTRVLIISELLCLKLMNVIKKNGQDIYQDCNFVFAPDSRFVYKTLISDARIQNSTKGQI